MDLHSSRAAREFGELTLYGTCVSTRPAAVVSVDAVLSASEKAVSRWLTIATSVSISVAAMPAPALVFRFRTTVSAAWASRRDERRSACSSADCDHPERGIPAGTHSRLAAELARTRCLARGAINFVVIDGHLDGRGAGARPLAKKVDEPRRARFRRAAPLRGSSLGVCCGPAYTPPASRSLIAAIRAARPGGIVDPARCATPGR